MFRHMSEPPPHCIYRMLFHNSDIIIYQNLSVHVWYRAITWINTDFHFIDNFDEIKSNWTKIISLKKSTTKFQQICCGLVNVLKKLTEVKAAILLEGLGQYRGCWCPGSMCRQDISSHSIDCVGCTL